MALSAANYSALPPRAALCFNAFHIRLIQEILANPGADSFDSFAEYMKQIEVYLDAVRIILPAPSAGEGDLLKSERQLVCAWLRRVLLDLLCALRHYAVASPTTSGANGPVRLAQTARRGRPLEHRDSHNRVFRSTIDSIVQTIASQPLLFGPLLPQDIPAIPDPSEDESSVSVRVAYLAYGDLKRLSDHAREAAATPAHPNETQYVALVFVSGGRMSTVY
ncbi:uncharacterized protein TRAVEDRAFT_47442 [Trametes versicolor FP-101664 SS1]|uniref:uncharacterized protein n=1 Tax=Trametes versicolor (strain FP-101664) TaxID=717944 RepID=UPI0004621F85|nr:uncharacterized protein TRAVEDRAFT_47442 [Trametes versicolor FP-101664 SS1]EIW58277.1 hypothetical protein TRAVEDRAFT_47442 [Trametes versicolor FP-101664 SS1]